MNLNALSPYLDRVVWTAQGHSLALGPLLLVLLLAFGGAVLARLVAVSFGKRLAHRFATSHYAREQAPRWVFFVVWSPFLLAALRVLGVPLTVFNFLGGAVALGFGFGAQNLCSNLISGVIVLFSRPYRIGDIVEVDQQTGTVLSIGLRATEVRTFDGVDLLVPNSYFLSNVIVNRTNFERSLRGLVAISAAYDSDTRLVDETLRAAAAAHPAVINSPGKAPWVIFDNFGVNGLEFKLFFWVDTTRNNVAGTASDVRHAVLAAFREKSIRIPSTQFVVPPPKSP